MNIQNSEYNEDYDPDKTIPEGSDIFDEDDSIVDSDDDFDPVSIDTGDDDFV